MKKAELIQLLETRDIENAEMMATIQALDSRIETAVEIFVLIRRKSPGLVKNVLDNRA
jgi:hypothetical protein